MSMENELDELASGYNSHIEYSMVNEEGETYDVFTKFEDALNMLASYPNDSINIRIV